MAEKFRYDPESENEDKERAKRLPFGICKAHGIKIEDWWSPRDAWNALQERGIVREVSEEYKEHFREIKRQKAKEQRKKKKAREEAIKNQEAMPEHTPDANYKHTNGAISGATKGAPMTFEQANSGHCNPYFEKGYIGYATNCQTCVATYVARRMGYNVRALPNLNNRDIRDLSYQTNLAYVTADGTHPTMQDKPYSMPTRKWIENTIREGEIYAIRGSWKGKRSGHIICIERENGNIRVYDPQTNKPYSYEEAAKVYFSRWNDIRMMNLTDVSMDESFCDKIMKKEG